jgi:glycine cleavage system aminomethyltransferase T
MKELKESVKEKLAEAVELWAGENLNGKPAILTTAVYFRLEKALLDSQKEIEKTFNRGVL